jgi:hypothetical protein
MLGKYCNFVKPGSSKETEETNSKLHCALSGEEAKRIYLNEINTRTNSEAVSSKHIAKDRAPKTISNHSKNIQVSDKDLLISAQNNDVETLKLALNNCPDKIHILDDYGWSLLMIACQANSIEVVKELLKQGADTSIRDKAGNSAQSLIIKNKNYELVDIFLSDKAKSDEVRRKNIKKSEIDNYFCDICNVSTVSKDAHLSSTVHNINLSKGKKIPSSYVIPSSNRGYQMMIKVGWDRESGLGPEGSGKKYPIKTVQKKDRKGLGHAKKFEAEDKNDSVNIKTRKTTARDHEHNRKMEVNFRRQFY